MNAAWSMILKAKLESSSQANEPTTLAYGQLDLLALRRKQVFFLLDR